MEKYDLVVIGAGPGGYIAAIRAAQLGWRVACVEQEEALGGTCLRVGCIPSKALLESSERYVEARDNGGAMGFKVGKVQLDLPGMLSRKDTIVQGLTGGVDMLFRKHKVTRVPGHGQITGPGAVSVQSSEGSQEISGDNILIATGSRSAPLRGVDASPPDGSSREDWPIGTSTEALSYLKVPKRLVVVGAGYIGLELGSVWRRLGSEVTVLEYLDRILPGMDAEIARDAQKMLEEQGIRFRLGCAVTGVKVDEPGCSVSVEGAEAELGDRVLVAVGRVPNTEGLGLESVGIVPDERGRIPVDASFATSAPGIYAVGDVIGGAMLAHKAEDEAVACVERLITGYGHVNYDAIPAVVYTNPEIATVGKTEEALVESGTRYRKGVFHFRANARARCLGDTRGKVKVLAHADTDRILGVHIMGPRAGDLIAEAAAAIEFGASSEDIARTSHAHPTLAEAFREAALAVDGRSLNS